MPAHKLYIPTGKCMLHGKIEHLSDKTEQAFRAGEHPGAGKAFSSFR